jgi:hypothetical protein
MKRPVDTTDSTPELPAASATHHDVYAASRVMTTSAI